MNARRTGPEWAKELGIEIVIPKGWGSMSEYVGDKINYNEFLNRAGGSICWAKGQLTRREAAKLRRNMHCVQNGKIFPEAYIHTMNPIGFQNMRDYILSYQKSLLVGTTKLAACPDVRPIRNNGQLVGAETHLL